MELKLEDPQAGLFPPVPDSSTLEVAVPRRHYAASVLCRAVEDADAQVLDLNVTGLSDDSRVVARLRVGARQPSGVARSLERYGCEVVWARAARGADAADEALADRAAQVLRMLEL